MLSLHVAVVLFGLTGVLAKLLPLSPLALVAGRTTVAWIVLLPAVMLHRQRRSQITGRLIIPGLILAAHWATFFRSIEISTVGVALLSFSTFPIFVIALHCISARVLPRTAELGAAAVVCLGVSLLVPPAPDWADHLAGVAWGVSSAVLFAVLSVVNSRSVAGSSPLTVAWSQNVGASFVTLPWLAAEHQWLFRARDLSLMLCLGAGCTALAHALFVRSLRNVPTSTASFVASLEPVYGMAIAVPALHEIPGFQECLGGVCILGAVVWITAPARHPAA